MPTRRKRPTRKCIFFRPPATKKCAELHYRFVQTAGKGSYKNMQALFDCLPRTSSKTQLQTCAAKSACHGHILPFWGKSENNLQAKFLSKPSSSLQKDAEFEGFLTTDRCKCALKKATKRCHFPKLTMLSRLCIVNEIADFRCINDRRTSNLRQDNFPMP